MKKSLLLIIALMFYGCAPHQQTIPITPTSHFESTFQENKQIIPDNSLDFQLANLTNQIVESLSQESKSKIAIIEFSDLNGNVTEFGMYLSEELITRLFLTQKFNVIERQLLNQVISEQKLGMTGLIDDESAIAIGKLLGVDAIVSGTVTDLGVSLKVNARLIATETGSVFAVAATEILKDEKVTILINRMKETKSNDIKKEETEKPEKKTIENKTTVGKRIFFMEDFSTIAEGMAPKDWIGCEQVMVKKGRTNSYLENFEGSSAKFIIPIKHLPENWKIDIVSERDDWIQTVNCNIGNLTFGYIVRNYCPQKVYMKNTYIDIDAKIGKNDIFILSLEKNGNLFTLYIDGAKSAFIRYPEFEPSLQLSVNFQSEFKLYKISGTELDELRD